jgi:hypothetical protein
VIANSITPNNVPSIKSKEHLEELSRQFTPTDVKFLLALNSSFSEEECIANAEKLIEDLKVFSESNFDQNIGNALGMKIIN